MSDTTPVEVNLNVGGHAVSVNVDLPKERVPIEATLPLLRELSSLSQQAGVDHLPEGRSVSCRAGCGACCAQIVPVARFEARAVASYVRSLPDDERTAVEERFADALRRLDDAGVLGRLRERRALSEDERTRVAYDYFKAGVPCPFLVDESCGIHPERPLRCREYLVTSPAAKCETPETEEIDPVDIPLFPSRAGLRVEAKANSDRGRDGRPDWVPLVLALEEEGEPPVKKRGPVWAGELLAELGLA